MSASVAVLAHDEDLRPAVCLLLADVLPISLSNCPTSSTGGARRTRAMRAPAQGWEDFVAGPGVQVHVHEGLPVDLGSSAGVSRGHRNVFSRARS
jgi:hypothetical protein